ncbi:MAG: iron-containing alcohol dehydrogenase, partial [Bacteroidota bacterium]
MISQTKGDLRVLSMQDYDVSFGPAGASLRKILDQQKYSQRVIIVDEHTRQHCLSILDKNLYDYIIEIPSGERHKTIATCERIWAAMAEYGCDRHSLVIDLGGGVIGDMGGYAASCYMRGIDFVQVPTTLLSQVDASVGGKLGVDFKGYKNFIGLFAHPRAVCVDPSFLKTLPYHELRSGY